MVICGNQDEVEGCAKPVDAVLPTTISNAIGTAEIEIIAPVSIEDTLKFPFPSIHAFVTQARYLDLLRHALIKDISLAELVTFL